MSLNDGDPVAALGGVDATAPPARRGGNGTAAERRLEHLDLRTSNAAGAGRGLAPAVPMPDEMARSGIGMEEDRLDVVVQHFFQQRQQQQQQESVKFIVGEDVPPSSELCLNVVDIRDDVSVLTSDTCFTNASAISETDSQLVLPDIWQHDDDLTFQTPPVLDHCKSSVPSLAATENNASQCSRKGDRLPSANCDGHSWRGCLLVPGFKAVLSDVRSAHRRLDQTIAYRLFLAKNRPAFEAVLSEVRSGARGRGPRSAADDPRDGGGASRLHPEFEAVLSDVKSGAHRRLRRQGTLTAISEAAPDAQDDSTSQTSEGVSTLRASQNVQFKGLPGDCAQRAESLERLPPPLPPPHSLPRADSVSEQLSRPSTPAAVSVEEETLYTAIADPVGPVSVGCNSTLTVSERSLLIQKGRCPMCGIQTHKVSGMFKRRYKPLSNEHVLSGRCLICNPINVVTHPLVETNAPAPSVGVETNSETNNANLDEGGGETLSVAKTQGIEARTENREATPSAPPLEKVLASETGGASDRPAPSEVPPEKFPDREAGVHDGSRSRDGSAKYFSKSESCEEVERWLLSRLPTLQQRDVERYRDRLAEEGFDSTAMLEVLEEGDLCFMKTAHRRVLTKMLRRDEAPPSVEVAASRSSERSSSHSLSSDGEALMRANGAARPIQCHRRRPPSWALPTITQRPKLEAVENDVQTTYRLPGGVS